MSESQYRNSATKSPQDVVFNRTSKASFFMVRVVGKRSVVIRGRKTSVSLEDDFWNELKAIAASQQLTVSELIDTVNSHRNHPNLSSALRLYVLSHYHRLAEISLAQKVEQKTQP
jgi:predicted DNA-binding ribbon-helix-helix protein